MVSFTFQPLYPKRKSSLYSLNTRRDVPHCTLWRREISCSFRKSNYWGADKSLARPTSRYILFDGENISFDASLVIYINSTNVPPIMIINRIYKHQRLRWSRGSVLAFSTQVRGFKPGRSRRVFKGEKILSTPSFGGEVKPSVPCRRFAACKRSQNGVDVVISAKLPDNILAHSSTFRR